LGEIGGNGMRKAEIRKIFSFAQNLKIWRQTVRLERVLRLSASHAVRKVVEPWGIEPQTFAMPSRRSPS
jgi:hypothetical protein